MLSNESAVPGTIYLSKYRPLAAIDSGLAAARQFGIPPYVDASCRREPDLQSAFPSISAICQGKLFAPKMAVGDIVVYITTLAAYDKYPAEHWRLSAVLKVIERFPTHEAAADWYRGRGLPLPSNCIVEDNPPIPLAETGGLICGGKEKKSLPQSLGEWDATYRVRMAKCGDFVVTRPLYLNIVRPPMMTQSDVQRIFPGGKMPLVRTPPTLSPEDLDMLLKTCGISIPAEAWTA